MFSQILSVTLCLSLLLPVGSAAETSQQPPRSEEIQNANAGMEKTGDRALDRIGHPTQAGGQQKTMATTRTPVVTESASAQALSQEEEASLSARAEVPGPEVSGGALSTLHLTYAVIALAAIVLVLLIK